MSEIIFDLGYSVEDRRRLTGPLSAALASWVAVTCPRLAGHLAGHPGEKSVIAVHVAATGLTPARDSVEAEGSGVWCLFLLQVDAPAIARGVLFVGGKSWIQTRLADIQAQLDEQLLAPGVKASVACSR